MTLPQLITYIKAIIACSIFRNDMFKHTNEALYKLQIDKCVPFY